MCIAKLASTPDEFPRARSRLILAGGGAGSRRAARMRSSSSADILALAPGPRKASADALGDDAALELGETPSIWSIERRREGRGSTKCASSGDPAGAKCPALR
jgi:hypothetical protein